jgi:hypothetical protein
LVCQQILNHSIALILVQTGHENQQLARQAFSAIIYGLGMYRIPVLGVAIRNSEFSKKHIYPTFLGLTPSFSNEAHVILQLLNQLNYRQIVILTVHGDKDAEEFVLLFNKIAKKIQVVV